MIHRLKALGVNILLGGCGPSLSLLKEAFPELESIVLPSYSFPYPEKPSRLGIKTLSRIPYMIGARKQEHRILDKLVNEGKVDASISDNRYGLFHEDIPNRIICHQVNVKLPESFKKYTGIFNGFHQRMLARFQEVWIPDYPNNILAGELSISNKSLSQIAFIGPLSRFSPIAESQNQSEFDATIILSGPEPQRSMLEEMVLQQIKPGWGRIMLIRGLPDNIRCNIYHNSLEIFNHLEPERLQEIIHNSKMIICRSGYSSIMDLYLMNSRAHFIPTPGQPEQEYLALHHEQKHCIPWSHQDNFKLADIIAKGGGRINKQSSTQNLCGEALEKFVSEI